MSHLCLDIDLNKKNRYLFLTFGHFSIYTISINKMNIMILLCYDRTADTMGAKGLLAADYEYCTLPHRIPSLMEYVHTRKLKFGHYSGRLVILIN